MRYLDKIGLAFVPLLLGLLFFAASLTPSLIPRDWLVQGILGGLVMALGYLIGRFLLSVWRAMDLPEPANGLVKILQFICAAPVILIVIICLQKAQGWQNGIRTRMGMELVDTTNTLQMLFVAIIVFAVLVLLGFFVQLVFDKMRRWLYRLMPARTANVAGLVLTILVVWTITDDGVLARVIDGLDKSYTVAQALFDTAPERPLDARITSGAEGSFIDWAAMGSPGRNYVTSGPSAANIKAISGAQAREPLRVYVGLAQADSPQERSKLALAELIRVGGFDRKVLIVALPTGTGWLDPGSLDPLEYMHGGNIATVAVQYSYLQSPLALVLETRSGLDQATSLISTIHEHWRGLPPTDRPRLYIHGLSLGAWSSMHGTDIFALLNDPIDGAFWVGPPFPSAFWQSIVSQRNPDSAYVAPIIRNGELVRFATGTQEPGGPDGWGDMRLMFLQYASDPIVFYEPASFFRAPAWMKEPAAADVSPDMDFIPVVTQFQLAVDMALATSPPAGHGHAYYAPDYIEPWVAVTNPENWSTSDTERLIAHCDAGFQLGCDHN